MLLRSANMTVPLALLATPLAVGLHVDAVSAQEGGPAASWTGFYLGAIGGYIRQDPDADVSFPAATSTFDPSVRDGFTVGGLGGAGLQVGPAYLGIEADMNYADIEGSDAGSGPFIPFGGYTEEFSSRLDWFATARGRAGFAPSERVLFYGTGGLALGEVETDYIRDESYLGTSSYAGSDSSVKIGWTAGGGMELAFTPAWMLSGEYLHIDLEDTDLDVNPSGGGATTPLGTISSSNDFDVVRFGVKHGF